MNDLPEGTPISEMTFDEFLRVRDGFAGWVYPKRDVSSTIPLFSKPQRAALNLYGWVAIAMLVAGVALPFVLGSWLWVLLVPGAAVVWRANRKSMEDFFVQNLYSDRDFYDSVRRSGMGVKVVLRPPRQESPG